MQITKLCITLHYQNDEDMEPMTKIMDFNKIETKADVLKFALEFTADNGKPNYDEAQKMFFFFTHLVDLPDTKADTLDTMTNYLRMMVEKKNEA